MSTWGGGGVGERCVERGGQQNLGMKPIRMAACEQRRTKEHCSAPSSAKCLLDHQKSSPMPAQPWGEFRRKNRMKHCVLWWTGPIDSYTLRKNSHDPDSWIFPYIDKHSKSLAWDIVLYDWQTFYENVFPDSRLLPKKKKKKKLIYILALPTCLEQFELSPGV